MEPKFGSCPPFTGPVPARTKSAADGDVDCSRKLREKRLNDRKGLAMVSAGAVLLAIGASILLAHWRNNSILLAAIEQRMGRIEEHLGVLVKELEAEKQLQREAMRKAILAAIESSLLNPAVHHNSHSANKRAADSADNNSTLSATDLGQTLFADEEAEDPYSLAIVSLSAVVFFLSWKVSKWRSRTIPSPEGNANTRPGIGLRLPNKKLETGAEKVSDGIRPKAQFQFAPIAQQLAHTSCSKAPSVKREIRFGPGEDIRTLEKSPPQKGASFKQQNAFSINCIEESPETNKLVHPNSHLAESLEERMRAKIGNSASEHGKLLQEREQQRLANGRRWRAAVGGAQSRGPGLSPAGAEWRLHSAAEDVLRQRRSLRCGRAEDSALGGCLGALQQNTESSECSSPSPTGKTGVSNQHESLVAKTLSRWIRRRE